MSNQTLLIEIGTEELPPKSLLKLSDAFSSELLKELIAAELLDQQLAQQSSAYASPRRLAVSTPQVSSRQPDQQVDRRGPAIQAAYDAHGKPTPAAIGFAKSCSVEVADLQTLKTDKGEWLHYTLQQKGKHLNELLPQIIKTAIKRLPIPKRMRWGAGSAEFVRPVHWLLILHGTEVVPAQILGIASANKTRGHRFHSPGEITIDHADNYQQILLQQGKVVASFAERQNQIKQQVKVLTQKLNGKCELEQSLLDEVTGLVELPNAILGEFDPEFLLIPAECLISSMADHQKYFHVTDQKGKLVPYFITISNITSSKSQQVCLGNERVLRARLSDAQFFWETDQKQPLASRVDALENVLFHVKLGSVADKTRRIQKLSSAIAQQINANTKLTERAALLSKADLVTDMVGEFDELQGIMGRYYAQLDGEDEIVSQTIEQHYWPKFAGDQLPISAEAQALALADRLDSLVGIFGAGEVPTGDKDPYGLRRSALAILRILIDKEHPLQLSTLVSQAASAHQDGQSITIGGAQQQKMVDFISGRLTAYYQTQDIPTTVINSVMACQSDQPLDFHHRLLAVHQFSRSDQADNLSAANKRISNILKKQSGEVSAEVSVKRLTEPAEIKLHNAITEIEKTCLQQFDHGQYSAGLELLACLKQPIDDFFDGVMVMSEDESVKQNRLALLSRLQALFLRVADISLLQ